MGTTIVETATRQCHLRKQPGVIIRSRDLSASHGTVLFLSHTNETPQIPVSCPQSMRGPSRLTIRHGAASRPLPRCPAAGWQVPAESGGCYAVLPNPIHPTHPRSPNMRHNAPHYLSDRDRHPQGMPRPGPMNLETRQSPVAQGISSWSGTASIRRPLVFQTHSGCRATSQLRSNGSHFRGFVRRTGMY